MSAAEDQRHAVPPKGQEEKIVADSIHFEWVIPGRQLAGYQKSKSGIFSGSLPLIQWRLEAAAEQRQLLFEVNVNVDLFLICDSNVEVHVDGQLQVKGTRLNPMPCDCYLRNGETTRFTFPIGALYRFNGERVLISDSNLVLNLSQELSYAKYYEAPDALSQCFGAMLDSGKFSDVVITTEDATQLPVHKAVLCARSTVFRIMFRNDAIDTKPTRIKITEFCSETVRDLVKYMYTGRIPKFRGDSATSLLKAACKYELPELVSMCFENLGLNLCVANAAQLLLLANAYGNGPVKEKILKFIATNQLEFRDASKLQLVKHSPDLLLDIISALAKVQPRDREYYDKYGE